MQRNLAQELHAATEANDETKFESLRLEAQEEQLQKIRELEANVNSLFAKKAPQTKAKLLGMLVESKVLLSSGEEGKATAKIEEIKKFVQDTVNKIHMDKLKKDLKQAQKDLPNPEAILEKAKKVQDSTKLFKPWKPSPLAKISETAENGLKKR